MSDSAKDDRQKAKTETFRRAYGSKRCAKPSGTGICDERLRVVEGWWVCTIHGRITQHGLSPDDELDDLAGENHERMEQFDRDRQDESEW